MRTAVVASTLILAAATAAALVFGQGALSQQLPLPPNGFHPPPPAEIKPYQPVAAPVPEAYGDPTFQAFRKQLLDVAAKKDRTALAKLVVAKGFFWMQDKDLAAPNKSGIDNLAKAIGLDAKDGSGWEILAGFASDPTGAQLPDRKGVVCAPADPAIDPKQFEALINATHTDPAEWGYPTKPDIELRAAAQPNAAVIEKLGGNLVRVLPDSGSGSDGNPPAFLHVAAPSGKSGYAPADSIAPLGGDQICYTQEGGAWKIAGLFGGSSP